MATCPYCTSTVADDNPVFVAMQLEEKLRGQWSYAEHDSSSYFKAWPIGHKMRIDGIGDAEVVAKKVKPDLDEMETGYFEDGSYPQGTEYSSYVVLKIGEYFYKTTGEGDSYGEIVWSNVVKPVTPKEETRVVYTFG